MRECRCPRAGDLDERTRFSNFDGLPLPTGQSTYSTPRNLITLGRAAMKLAAATGAPHPGRSRGAVRGGSECAASPPQVPPSSTLVAMGASVDLLGYSALPGAPSPSVLLVEDDQGIATQLVRGLIRGGYRVDHVLTGREALAWGEPDVVLLDLGLPDADGVHICRQLRERSASAIIVVTARGEEAERVLALDAGADDYLVKPFGLAELQARIRAVLRRIRPEGEVARHGPLTVDMRRRKVSVSGTDIALTPKEFDILECLAADPGRVVSRQEILESAWDLHWYGPTKVLDVHMAALRKKLGVPGLIETVYGRGFRLSDA